MNENDKREHSCVVAVPYEDLRLLRAMMLCTSGNEVVSKFGDKVPGLLGSNGEIRAIVYTLSFDDGKEMDIEFAVNTSNESPYVVAMIYDNGECVGEFQPENPAFSFPGNFSVTVGNDVYCTSFGAEFGRCQNLFCMTDLLSDSSKTLRPDFLQIPEVPKVKVFSLAQQIQAAESIATTQQASPNQPVKGLDR